MADLLDTLDRIALPKKLQLPVIGSLTVLVWGAVFYFTFSDWWLKRFFSWYWESLVETVKTHWLVFLVMAGVVILVAVWNAIDDYRNPPHYYTMEDLEDF